MTPGPDLYLQLMQHNTKVIKHCLNADMKKADEARNKALLSEVSELDSFSGRFILTNQFSKTFTGQDMRGKYSLIFFGYTYCPDICPTNLLVITQTLKQLGPSSRQLQRFFISIDPERDTTEVLNKYTRYFDKRVMGLTGSSAMISRVANQFKVKYEKGEVDSDQPGLYSMDHSTSFFLLAPDGRFISKFAYGIDSKSLAAELEAIMK
jgi:cytochrome oxidase Cu insertion factor (SCO1/SenC/PrrC family)